MNDTHNRKCWDCGNVAQHESRVVPGVLCKQCGSQDTRAVKEKKNIPLTPAEITAAERVRFESYYSGLDFSRIKKGLRSGDYVSDSAHIRWQAWCAAVNCDPMGDV